MKILLAILIFGFLILIHELGHYVTARLFKVGVNEFSIGMGPKLFQKVSKKTGIAYSLRALPIGGYVSMDGEENDSETERSLNRKPKWQRFIIMSAGAFMNILVGIVLTTVLVAGSDGLGTAKVAAFPEKAVSNGYGLCVGDEITKVGSHGVHTLYDLSYAILHDGNNEVDVTVVRNGKKVTLHDVNFPVTVEGGMKIGLRDFYVEPEEKTFVNVVKQSFWRSVTSCRMIWESLIDLIKGRYGIESLSGPVGVTGAISEAAKQGSDNLLSLTALIALNLGICNLLPFPALDGGRILLLIIEAIRRKPLKHEVENYINLIGLALLMLLMLAVTYLDITRLVK